jgi:hypothetical protein
MKPMQYVGIEVWQVKNTMVDQAFIVTPHVSKPHDYVNHMFMRL